MDQISMTMNYTLGKISNSISGDDGLLIRFLETRLPAMDTRSLSFLIAPTLLYSIWYLASFVFPALLMSKKPKVLPYRVPVLGHAMAFYKDPYRVINEAICTVFRSRDVFAVYILGQISYIITSPHDVSPVYNDATSFKFDIFLNDTLLAFGVDKRSLDLAWCKPVPGDACYRDDNPVNPKQKPFVDWIKETYRKALLPGPYMDSISRAFNGYVNREVQSLDLGAGTKDLSLKDLIRAMMGKAITGALFGDCLLELEPDIVSHSDGFSAESWRLIFRLPSWAAKRVIGHREVILSALDRFCYLPKAERILKGSSWPIETLLIEQEILGMSARSNNSFLLLINWAANFNTSWTCFWLLSHLLWEPGLLADIKRETQAAIIDGELDFGILLTSCPLLQSCLLETLRLDGNTITARGVAESRELSGKVVKQGNRVLIPHRVLNRDELIWGRNSEAFQADRFIKDKSLETNPAYRPFGGGSTYCPGRVIAKLQISIFIAVFLDEFEVELVPGQQFPTIDNTQPSVGTTGPSPDTDVRVVMSRSGVFKLDRANV